MVTRDVAAEQRAVGAFRAANGGRMPDIYNNPADRAQVYKIAYPPSMGLPAELAGTVDQSLYAAGLTPANQQSNPLVNNSGTVITGPEGMQASTISSLQNATNQLEGPMSASNQNEFGRVLQDAIRRSAGTQNVQLGESKLMQAAGVTGYNALAQSLDSHKNEMVKSSGDLQRLVGDLTGAYKAQADDALAKYNIAYKQYEAESARLQESAMYAREQADYVKNLRLEQKITQENEAFKNRLNKESEPANFWAELGGGGTTSGGGDFDSFVNALSGQESGGTADPYKATNARTGASGKFQIMPGNWAGWAAEAGLKGASMTPENQEIVARYKLKQYYDKFGPELAAVAWYAGPGNAQRLKDGKTTLIGAGGKEYSPYAKQGAGNEPSVMEYAKSVMSKAGIGTSTSTTATGWSKAKGWVNGVQQVPAATTPTPTTPVTVNQTGIPSKAELEIAGLNIKGTKGTGPAQENYDKVAAQIWRSGGDEALWRFMKGQYVEGLSGTEKTNFQTIKDGADLYEQALALMDSMPNLKSGFYKKTSEGIKPYYFGTKDPEYIALIDVLAQAEAALRQGKFGVSLTPTEMALSKQYFLDTNDSPETIREKVEINKLLMDRSIQSRLYSSVGLPAPESYTKESILAAVRKAGGGGTTGTSQPSKMVVNGVTYVLQSNGKYAKQ